MNAEKEKAPSSQTSSLIAQLDEALTHKDRYVEYKKRRIDSLKTQFTSTTDSSDRHYQINAQLIEEYKSYVYDSAMKYVTTNLAIASRMNSVDKLNESKIRHSTILLSAGMYKEAVETLQSIPPKTLSAGLRKNYYHCFEQTYHHLSNYSEKSSYGDMYKQMSRVYIDSLLLISQKGTDEYKRLLARKEFSAGNRQKAKTILLEVLQKKQFGSHDYAMICSTLSQMVPSGEERKRYLLLSAISDVISTVKENESLRNLAIELYAEGDIARAYHYCTASMDDANFYNARLRSLEIAKIQPIIDKTYRLKIEEQRERLQAYLFVISILFVLLTAFFIALYMQKKYLNIARAKLLVSNSELSKLNKSLSEANVVKEEYVGHFMSLCSSYITKLKHYQSMVYSKIVTGKIDELRAMTKSSELIELEMKQFYSNFDKAFLKIYPNFISEFNELLREEEHFVLSKDKLTPELRIFALMRLGITDTALIAKFLQYSTNTVYTYRTKIKNKSINRNEFEANILNLDHIKSIF